MHPQVLLVHPWIHDFAAYDLWARPMGLLVLASWLRRCGCDVTLIDCLAPDPADRTKRKADGRRHFRRTAIARPDCLAGVPRQFSRYGIAPAQLAAQLGRVRTPDLILVGSMMTYWYSGVVETIQWLKQVFPAVPLVLGGVYATLCPEHARRVSGADAVVTGPAEQTLGPLLQRYLPAVSLPPAGTVLPEPAFDLLPDRSVLPLLTSRGCPFSCHYCASGQLYPGFVRVPWPRVAAQVTRWCSPDATTDIAFYDDALLVDAPQYLIPLLQQLRSQGVQARFHVPNGLHARYVTPELARQLFAAGFTTIRLGLETADPQVQRDTGGKVSCAQFRQAAQALGDAGFSARHVGAYILAGLPDQQPQSVRDAVHFAADAGVRPIIAEYSPIPGTRMWPRAVAVSPFPLGREPLFHNNTLLPCRSSDFTVADLAQLKQEAHRLG